MKKRKENNHSFKTLFTIPVDLKSTKLSLERVNLTKKNLFELIIIIIIIIIMNFVEYWKQRGPSEGFI